jgi:hypothetical protein
VARRLRSDVKSAANMRVKMNLNGSGDRGVNNQSQSVLGLGAFSERYRATYDALWAALGDDWIADRQRCVIVEPATSHTLTIEAETPYRLQVCYHGAEAEDPCWSVELTREGPDGWGGYEVCGVISDTGHSTEALNGRLLQFHELVAAGAASILRAH